MINNTNVTKEFDPEDGLRASAIMRYLHLSNAHRWRSSTKVINRNLQKMSANSSPGKSNGDDVVDANIPRSILDNIGSRIRDRIDVDTLRRYLASKLVFVKPEPTEKVLDEVSVDGVVKWINNEKCKNIITLAGAGISTSAGIPDFRSPETGLYHNLQKYDLPEPQAIFEINFFRQNPKPFFTLAKELFPGSFKPTISHYFIKMLHEKGLLLRHYTQNIDTLERGAGIPEQKIVEAHGTFYTSHCLECRKLYSLEYIKERIFADEIPICTECPGVIKPDIVFFGESLPERFQSCVQEDFDKCDLLIIMGSSLEVQPFASLIDMVPDSCPRLLINREKAGVRSPILRSLGVLSEGLNLDEGSTRDVALLGDCDNGCRDVANRLGWGEELEALVRSEHARLDALGLLSQPHRHVSMVPNVPIAPHVPIVPHIPIPILATVPDVPDVSMSPNISNVPDIPHISDVPMVPNVSNVPDIPHISDVPMVPNVSNVPDIPHISGVPMVPNVSHNSHVLGMSDVPMVPHVPTLPHTGSPTQCEPKL